MFLDKERGEAGGRSGGNFSHQFLTSEEDSEALASLLAKKQVQE